MIETVAKIFLMMALVIGLVQPILAQSLDFEQGNSSDPIEITADDGIEWQRESQVILARGNARATRGTTQVDAQVLRAYYRETPDQGVEIWRLDAEGRVVVSTPSEKAYGDTGLYDVDNAVFVLKGQDVKLVINSDTVTADGQLEYWQNKNMAVARGNAVAVHGDKKLKADVLSARFRQDKKGITRIYLIEAFDDVRINTKTDTAVSDYGVYNIETGIVTLSGSVKISRLGNVLNGCGAVVDLNTGISKLSGCSDSSEKGGRVSGTLIPKTQKK